MFSISSGAQDPKQPTENNNTLYLYYIDVVGFQTIMHASDNEPDTSPVYHNSGYGYADMITHYYKEFPLLANSLKLDTSQEIKFK